MDKKILKKIMAVIVVLAVIVAFKVFGLGHYW
jgi:hypothetical protein